MEPDTLIEGGGIAFLRPHFVHQDIVPVPEEVVVGDKSFQRLPDHVDVDRSDGDTQPGQVKVGKVTMVEGGVVRPARDIAGELSLVSRGEEVLEVADMKLDHSETKTIKY